jgi:hypothetical protein
MIKLKDVIHYYIGCDVIVDDNERGRLLGCNPIPNSVGQVYWDIQTEDMKANEDEDFAMPYNDDPDMGELRIKPILRRFKDITDPEITEVAIMYANGVKVERVKGVANNWFYFKCNHSESVEDDEYILIISDAGSAWYDHYFDKSKRCGLNICNENYVTHYLLSKHFDIFGLIDIGEAIDAKTISNGIGA